MSATTFYAYPEIYDAAVRSVANTEIDRIAEILARYATRHPAVLCEPACGTGAYLAAAVRRGHTVCGYDLSPEMVRFARARLAREPGADFDVREGDLRAPPDLPCDAAFVLADALSYVPDVTALRRHFASTFATLRPGGVYVLETLQLSARDPALPSFSWASDDTGMRQTCRWRVQSVDHATSRYASVLTILRDGVAILHDEEDAAYWPIDELVAALRAAGGRVLGFVDADLRSREFDVDRSGLYFLVCGSDDAAEATR